MSSLRRHEGWFMSDNRVSGGALIERAAVTCSHCPRVVIMNPDRTRARGYCPKCDHYVCDLCEAIRVATGECHPKQQIFDDFKEQAALAVNLSQV